MSDITNKCVIGLRLVCGFAVATTASWPRACRGEDFLYTVSGALTYKSDVFKKEESSTFTVCVSNCCWSISGTAAAVGNVKHKEVFDGLQVSTAALFTDEVARKASIKNDATLSVEPRDTPNCLPGIRPGIIWLAYASACKLSGQGDGKLEPAWAIDQTLVTARYRTPASWVLSREPPYLPTEVKYFFDAATFYPAISQPVPSGPKSRTKQIWASFRTLEFASVGRLVLPKSFEFDVYFVDSPQAGQVISVCRGEISSAHEGIPEDALQPGFGTTTLVVDSRFVSAATPSAFVRYVTGDKMIPGTNDPMMVKRAVRANLSTVIMDEKGRGPRRSRMIGLLIILGGVVALPVLLVLSKKAKTRQEMATHDRKVSQ